MTEKDNKKRIDTAEMNIIRKYGLTDLEDLASREVTLMMYVTEKDGAEQVDETINVIVPLSMHPQEILDIFVKTLIKRHAKDGLIETKVEVLD